MNIYERSVNVILSIIEFNQQDGITFEDLILEINNNYNHLIFPCKIEDIVEMNINFERLILKNNRLYLSEEGKKTLAFTNNYAMVSV
jgi:hypothetical protein